KRHVRRDEYVASIKQARHTLMPHRAREDHSPSCNLSLEPLLNLNVQAPAPDKQKPDPLPRWNQLDRFRKLLNAVPRSKRPDKPCNHLIISDAELASRLHTTNTRPKPLNVNTIRIDNNLLCRH